MSIFDKVLAFIRDPRPELFEPLALEVFRHQFKAVAPYRRYCLGLGVGPKHVGSLDAIPPVSTVAFKYAELRGAVTRAPRAGAVFISSGTSRGLRLRGRHFVPRLEVYRASALAHLGRMLFPDGRRMRMLALHPTAKRMPESSLARMITWCVEEFGAGPPCCAADRGGVDVGGAIRFLCDCERVGEPVCLLGTTAAFGLLFEGLKRRGRAIRVPAGSRIMDTGGAKGQAKPLTPAAMAEAARRMLGIEPPLVINEYGMTEMCSQLYDATAFNSASGQPPGRRLKVAPPWLHVAAVDPQTRAPLAPGKFGMLGFVDLANVGSVSALLTEDVGAVVDGGVLIAGRADTAEPRGCALGLAEFAAVEAN